MTFSPIPRQGSLIGATLLGAALPLCALREGSREPMWFAGINQARSRHAVGLSVAVIGADRRQQIGRAPGRGRQPAVGCGWPDSQLMSVKEPHAVTSRDGRVGLRHAAAPAWCVASAVPATTASFRRSGLRPPDRGFRQLVGGFRSHLFSKIRLYPSREQGAGGATRLQPLGATTIITGDDAAGFQHRRAQR
jgi:hypothetical protein